MHVVSRASWCDCELVTRSRAAAYDGAVTGEESAFVALVPVDDIVLDQLVRVAIADAAADEVTPSLTLGEMWTPARVAWLREYHYRCRDGLTGSAGEATWAVVVEQEVVGSVRLKNTAMNGMLETGIWLSRKARSRGIGRRAIAAVVREATLLGASGVRADTALGNTAALNVLRCLGFDIAATETGNDVCALLRLRPEYPD